MSPHSPTLIVALLAVAPAATAQPWTPLGSEFQVNSSTTGHQSRPSIAGDAAGNFVILWDGEGLGDDQGILGQRFQSDGAPLGSEFWANSNALGSQTYPSVGRADNGDFVVVWDNYYAGDTDVWAQRFSSSGTRTGPNFRVNGTAEPDQYRNDLAVLPDGRFIVVWTASEPISGAMARGEWTNAEVIARGFAADGTPLGVEFQVNTNTTDRHIAPTIAATSDGGFVVAWNSDAQYADRYEILAQRFDSGGGKVGSEFQVNSYTTGLQYTPSVAVTDDDGFVVVWSSKYQDGDSRGVHGQRFDSIGGPAGAEFQVNTYTTGPQGRPTVLASSSGGFLVAWEGPEVHAKLYRSSGDPVGDEYVVNSYLPSLQVNPALSGDPDGPFVATWISFGQDGDGLGVFAQRFLGSVFIDGFESGDSSAWSNTVSP